MDRLKILLCLKDEDDRNVFSSSLTAAGFEVSTAKDGAHALEIAIQDVPSAVIAGLDAPVISGERVFQILRGNPHTSRIPFVFVSDSVSDIKGFRTGIDVFLLKPVNAAELTGRVRQSVAMNAAPKGAKEIEGRLIHMSLADILQFLHLNKKEGELKISAGDASGVIYIKDGQIYNAVLSGVEREKALFRMLSLSDGKFEFIPMGVSVAKKIRSTAGSLLMEGMRQIDEFKKRESQFPDKTSAVKPRVDTGSLPKGLQPVIYEVMQLVRTYQRVGDIVERCSATDYEVYSTLKNLINRGILEEHSPKQDAGAAEFLTVDQMISIREKIISRFSGIFSLNYGKIFIISTSGRLTAGFISQCRRIPGFSVEARSAFAELSPETPVGPVAELKLYGGMDLVVFSIPAVKGMGPLWRAFQSNLVGLIVLWDSRDASAAKDLAAAKRDILLKRRVPVAHVFAGAASKEEEAAFRKTLNLKPEEPFFRLNGDKAAVSEVFYGLFSTLIKDDYVTA